MHERGGKPGHIQYAAAADDQHDTVPAEVSRLHGAHQAHSGAEAVFAALAAAYRDNGAGQVELCPVRMDIAVNEVREFGIGSPHARIETHHEPVAALFFQAVDGVLEQRVGGGEQAAGENHRVVERHAQALDEAARHGGASRRRRNAVARSSRPAGWPRSAVAAHAVRRSGPTRPCEPRMRAGLRLTAPGGQPKNSSQGS